MIRPLLCMTAPLIAFVPLGDRVPGHALPLHGLVDGDVLGSYAIRSSQPTPTGDIELTLVVELTNQGAGDAALLQLAVCDPGGVDLPCPGLSWDRLPAESRVAGTQTLVVSESTASAWRSGIPMRFRIRCQDGNGMPIEWCIPFIDVSIPSEG